MTLDTYEAAAADLGITVAQYEDILEELQYAEKKHPEGATLEALATHLGRYADARVNGDDTDQQDQLRKVITVAMRLIAGQEDTSYQGEAA